MIVGVILAAGRGTRFGSSEINKTATLYLGKPIVCYGADLLSKICDKIIVVTGFAKESVENVLNGYKNIIFAEQKDPQGTGHSFEIAINKINDRYPIKWTQIL